MSLQQMMIKEKINEVNLTQVDIWLEDHESELFLIDLKTAKPNKSDFQKFI